MERVQLILSQLGEMEDEIFKMRQHNEQNFRRRNKQKKFRERTQSAPAVFVPNKGPWAPTPLGAPSVTAQNAKQAAYQMRVQVSQ